MPWASFQEPEEEDEAAALSVDWRAYSQTHTLSDKQQKLAEKIRKRENRIAALQKEVDKIRVRVRLAISTCCILCEMVSGLPRRPMPCVWDTLAPVHQVARFSSGTIATDQVFLDQGEQVAH